MNVSVEHIGPCKKLVRVEIDAAAVDAEFKKATDGVIRKANLPGFRPGKAPRALVEKTFSHRIEEEVRRTLLGDYYRKAMEQESLRQITYPDIEEGTLNRGEPFQFSATVETEPQFDLPDYKGLTVERRRQTVSDDDITKALEVLQNERAQFTDVPRPVQEGDYVVVNYQGQCEQKPLRELAPEAPSLAEQKAFWMHITADFFVPGFTPQLIGAQAGDQRTVTVTFPAEFVVPEVAGKTGVYAVEVLQVKEKVLPPVDDDFAKVLGAPDAEKLREGVRHDLENELRYKLKQDIRNQLVAGLLARVNYELPDSLVHEETRQVVYDIVKTNQDRGITKQAIDERKDEIYTVATNSARERVKANILLMRIAEKENIQASQEEMMQRILRLAEQAEMKPEKLVKQLQERGALGEIQQQIITAKVLDFLELNARIVESGEVS